MKRWLTFVLALALAVALGGVLSRIPEALVEVEAFKVTEVRLRGARFLTHDEVVQSMDLSPAASVWDDKKVLELRIGGHPLVKDVTVHRRFPHALLVQVVEREPVALVPNPTLEPVDEFGQILPIDPAFHKLDLPIMASGGPDGPGSLTAAGLRLLAGELSRLSQGAPEFHSRISDLTLYPRGDMRVGVSDSPVTLHIRPGVSSGRIGEGLMVLADAQAQFGGGEVVELDLRFKDQVVVRFNRVKGN